MPQTHLIGLSQMAISISLLVGLSGAMAPAAQAQTENKHQVIRHLGSWLQISDETQRLKGGDHFDLIDKNGNVQGIIRIVRPLGFSAIGTLLYGKAQLGYSITADQALSLDQVNQRLPSAVEAGPGEDDAEGDETEAPEAGAESTDESTPPPDAMVDGYMYRNIRSSKFTMSPLQLVLGDFLLQYEQRLSPKMMWGVSAFYGSDDLTLSDTTLSRTAWAAGATVAWHVNSNYYESGFLYGGLISVVGESYDGGSASATVAGFQVVPRAYYQFVERRFLLRIGASYRIGLLDVETPAGNTTVSRDQFTSESNFASGFGIDLNVGFMFN